MLVPEALQGHFFTGDCYLVLGGGTIFLWLGEASETEQHGAVQMIVVELGQWWSPSFLWGTPHQILCFSGEP